MEKRIIEGNKLIAKFMGSLFDVEGRVPFLFSVGSAYDGFDSPEIICTYDNVQYTVLCELDEHGAVEGWVKVDVCSYHNSWDWLIPVIKKCGTIKENGCVYYEKINIAMSKLDINEVWSSVVVFIKENI